MTASGQGAGVVSVADERSTPRRADKLSFATAIGCILAIGIFLRPGIVAVGPLLPSIRDAFELSHAQASLLVAIPDVLMGVLALPTPQLAARYGRNRVVLAALFLLLMAMVARSFASSQAMLWLTTAGIGAGIAISGALITGFIKAMFPERGALLIGVYATSLALGSIIAAAGAGPAANILGGWRAGTGAWAIPGVTAIAAWLFIGRKAHPAPQITGDRARLPLHVATAWLGALFFACDNFLFYSGLAWIASIYRERGYDAAEAGLILACFTAPMAVAPMIASAFSLNRDRRAHLAFWSALALVGSLLLALAPDAAPRLSVALLSLGIGGGFTLSMALLLDHGRTPEEATAWNAFMLMIAYTVAAAGPFTLGLLRDATGSFVLPRLELVGVAGLMLLLSPTLRVPHDRA